MGVSKFVWGLEAPQCKTSPTNLCGSRRSCGDQTGCGGLSRHCQRKAHAWTTWAQNWPLQAAEGPKADFCILGPRIGADVDENLQTSTGHRSTSYCQVTSQSAYFWPVRSGPNMRWYPFASMYQVSFVYRSSSNRQGSNLCETSRPMWGTGSTKPDNMGP